MKKLLLATLVALGLASAVAYAGVNAKQTDTGGMCWEFTSGSVNTDAWCWSSLGILDFTPATTAANSAATNDSMEIVLNSPVDTTGTNTHNALTLDIGIGNATGGTNVVTGLQVDAISGDAQVTTNGINIGAMTDAGTTNGIVIGTGWDAGILSSSDIEVLVGNLVVGNGTPGVTLDGEDAYIEGTLEVDGAVEFDGAIDIDSTITIDSTLINEETLKNMARTEIMVCGDATTVNANTIYYGPSQAVVSSATVGQMTCDTTAAGNATEATADAPALQATAFYPLGMVCYQADGGVTITYTLRSAEAAITPAISLSIADNILSGTANATATTAVASAATLAVAVASASDVATANVPFICKISVAY